MPAVKTIFLMCLNVFLAWQALDKWDNLIGAPRESRLKGASREARQLDYLLINTVNIRHFD